MPKRSRRLYSIFEVCVDQHGRRRYLSASDTALPLDQARRVFQNRMLAHALGQDEKRYELRPIDSTVQRGGFFNV